MLKTRLPKKLSLSMVKVALVYCPNALLLVAPFITGLNKLRLTVLLLETSPLLIKGTVNVFTETSPLVQLRILVAPL